MYRNSGLLYTRHKVAIMCEGLLTPHLEHRWPHTPHKATSYTHVVRRLGSQLWPGYWDLNCNDNFFLNGKNARKIHTRWLRFAVSLLFSWFFHFSLTVHVISNIVLQEFHPILSSSSSTSWEKIDCEMTTTKNRSIRRWGCRKLKRQFNLHMQDSCMQKTSLGPDKVLRTNGTQTKIDLQKQKK